MNPLRPRTIRRAQRRLAGKLPVLRKITHKLPAQTCALWVPDAQGYIVHFCPHSFRVVEFAEHAHHYSEHDASSAALTFREITGLRVEVRPVYAFQFAGESVSTVLDALGGHS